MEIVIEKQKRTLTLYQAEKAVFVCKVALGFQPNSPKRISGDGKTPEGTFYFCIIKEAGKYGRSLGLSYPDEAAAKVGLAEGMITEDQYEAIRSALLRRVRPPWSTALGGEIYIHEGGTATDWTAGCIALEPEAMDVLFPYRNQIERIRIFQ
ncbi:MAG: L,D-transpeptidase [Eubacteriales bacterium]|nr:L,D-transpeptidase [Eubacteriales bacterium]